MKKIVITIFLATCISSVFSQQFLWATDTSYNAEFIPINKAVDRVLDYYYFYDYYLDGSGFNKDSFIDYLSSSLMDTTGFNDFIHMIKETDSLTVFAWRVPTEEGSAVLVMSLSGYHVNIITFFNFYDPNSIPTSPLNKVKFSKWFESLLK